MSNNYLQFSEILKDVTEEEAKWAKDRLKEMTDKFSDGDGEEGWYFQWEVHEGHKGSEDDDMDTPHIWLYADEGGEPEHVVAFAREFLKKFRPDDCFSISWAAWCDKLRPGQFDGGAVFVTAEKEEWFLPYDFISAKTKAFEAKKKSAS